MMVRDYLSHFGALLSSVWVPRIELKSVCGACWQRVLGLPYIFLNYNDECTLIIHISGHYHDISIYVCVML